MREKPRDKERIQHIFDEIQNIEKFTIGISIKEFKNNKNLQYAVIKCFEIIGEAAYHTTKDLRHNYPQIEWKRIIDFRHILVHYYYRIDLEIIWDTIENDLPKLKKVIFKIMNELNSN